MTTRDQSGDMAMGQSVVVVDAFTEHAFAGNPAAVCVLKCPRDDRWMQRVAREMNLSETAFVYSEGEQGGYRLRWFTPNVEVDLCGHATLATAHALWTEGHLPHDTTARFATASGLLTADYRQGWIELDFPATPLKESAPLLDLGAMARLIGAPVVSAGYSRFDLLIELESEEAVRSLSPDIGALKSLPVRGIIATARATTRGFDFVSRFFAPAVGVDEDPVCGSAHCCLGPFWSERLGKTDLIAYQASPRGGVLRVGIRGDRVRLGGQAVTVMRGELVH